MADIPNSAALAEIIRALGGTPVEARTLQFDCPLSVVRELVPRLNSLGVACEKRSERVESTVHGDETIARIECLRRSEREQPTRLMDLLQW